MRHFVKDPVPPEIKLKTTSFSTTPLLAYHAQQEPTMARVHDVAAYILEQQGSMTAMKLQKLVYYSQAWHLVWEERPLFISPIEAWANGPVVRELYNYHRGTFSLTRWAQGDSSQLEESEKTTIDAVLRYYGDKPPQWLSDLTHQERPWREARQKAGAVPGERCSAVIDAATMAEYYSSLLS